MFSVDTEAEARTLLVAACPRGLDGEFYARELAEEQTLENLEKFGQRLEDVWNRMKNKNGRQDKIPRR